MFTESVMTSREAAESLGVSQSAVVKKCLAGDFESARHAGRVWLIDRNEVISMGYQMQRRGAKPGPKVKK